MKEAWPHIGQQNERYRDVMAMETWDSSAAADAPARRWSDVCAQLSSLRSSKDAIHL